MKLGASQIELTGQLEWEMEKRHADATVILKLTLKYPVGTDERDNFLQQQTILMHAQEWAPNANTA